MASKINKGEILAKFFDDGEYTALFADGAVSAACGYAAGQQAYAVYQNGEAVTVKDVEKNIKVLEMAAQTGCPVVTFYNSVGAKLAEGLDVLTASAKLNAQIAKVSGVVPQVAVVLGVCGGTSALSAANADVCIMAEGAELFFTAPFTSAAKGDKVADAGSAAAAAKAGVASIVTADAAEAAEKAAHIVGLLPANNLTGPAIFEFEQPTAVLAAGAEPAKAAAAVIDKDSAVELYAGFGKSVYTAFATIGGNAVGVVATGKQLCHNCVAKASRFVRLCDAFSVPVVTIVDTEGFVPSVTDDVAGGICEAARLAATYADATTAKVAVLAGKAVGPVYTALAAADLRIAVTGCTVSALEPSAAVSVLYKDEIDASDNIIAATKAKAAAYTAEVCSAASAVAAGAADMSCDAANVRASVVAALELLSTKRAARLPKKHGNMAVDRSLPWKDWVNGFCKGYENALEEGRRVGLQVFFGWESGYNGTEFLIHGLDKEWLLTHPEIKDADVPTQYALVHEAGGMVIHAHPFREASYISEIRLFPDYVDGVEGVNATHSGTLASKRCMGHPEFNARALAYAKEHSLALTAGSDQHSTEMVYGGMVFNRRLENSRDFIKAVLGNEAVCLLDGTYNPFN